MLLLRRSWRIFAPRPAPLWQPMTDTVARRVWMQPQLKGRKTCNWNCWTLSGRRRDFLIKNCWISAVVDAHLGARRGNERVRRRRHPGCQQFAFCCNIASFCSCMWAAIGVYWRAALRVVRWHFLGKSARAKRLAGTNANKQTNTIIEANTE